MSKETQGQIAVQGEEGRKKFVGRLLIISEWDKEAYNKEHEAETSSEPLIIATPTLDVDHVMALRRPYVAVVTEEGGILSHDAIMSREEIQHVPAVRHMTVILSADGITNFPDRQMVEVEVHDGLATIRTLE